jgi:hypothetical protein
MPMKLSYTGIFEDAMKQKTRQGKIEKLRSYSSPMLKLILGLTYDKRVTWLLPSGTPPFKSLSDHSDGAIDFNSTLKKARKLFTEGGAEVEKNLKQHKREDLFISTLEALDPSDAKILLGMKDRKLPFKGLTEKLVSEAFPNLTADWKK